jgi:hypothetical protein
VIAASAAKSPLRKQNALPDHSRRGVLFAQRRPSLIYFRSWRITDLSIGRLDG